MDSKFGRAHPELAHLSPFTAFVKNEYAPGQDCSKLSDLIIDCRESLCELLETPDGEEAEPLHDLCCAYDELRLNFCRKMLYYGYLLGRATYYNDHSK